MPTRIKNFFSYSCILLIAVFAVSLVAFSNPKKAEAVCGTIPATPAIDPTAVPVRDQANLVANTMTATHLGSLYQKECIQDGVVTIAAKLLIQEFTRNIVDWINSGFQGNPAFVDDPGEFFAGVGDRVIGEFIDRSALGFLCDPFSLSVRLGLALQYSRFEDKGCRLSDVIDNVDGFIEGRDFGVDGWNNWVAITNREGGNPYDAYLRANSQLSVEIAGAYNTELMKLNWGRGFLSFQDENGRIKTPGVVIEGQLSNTLGSGVRELELADEIDEIVGALANQMLQYVIGGLNN